MSRWLAVAWASAPAVWSGMQAPINSRLGKTVGSAAGRDLLVPRRHPAAGLIAAFGGGGLGALGQVRHVPWWALVGGLLGAVYVSVALIAVRTLGASGLTAVVIAGQLAISVAIDRFGLFGLARQHIDAQRVVGLVLLVAGVVLVVRK